MIRVVNVKGMNTAAARGGVCYVGRPFAGWRGHPLANPFRPGDGGIGPCLDRYRDMLLARPTLDADLAALWEQTGRGLKPLGCWCTTAVVGDGRETVCHAQILAALLAARFVDAPDVPPVTPCPSAG